MYPAGDIEPLTQSTIPSGCYSTHILLFEGTTIVRLEDAHQNVPGEKTDLSDIQSMHIWKSSSNVSQLWPTFNCAFATMVHGLEKIKKYKTIGIPSNTLRKKSVLILVTINDSNIDFLISNQYSNFVRRFSSNNIFSREEDY